MKKLLFLFSFLLLIGVTVNAQTAKKACCNSKTKKCSKSANVEKTAEIKMDISEALKAAEASEDIKTRTCSKSGKVSFFQKIDNEAGETDWVKVSYDTTTKNFTQVASASAEKEIEVIKSEAIDKKCGKDCKKACCAGEAKAKVDEKKACCKKNAKSSCKGSTATANIEADKVAPKKACCKKDAKSDDTKVAIASAGTEKACCKGKASKDKVSADKKCDKSKKAGCCSKKVAKDNMNEKEDVAPVKIKSAEE